MRAFRPILLAALCALAFPSLALDAEVVGKLASDDSDDKIAAIRALAQSADPAAVRVLQALSQDELQVAGGRVVTVEGGRVLDAATGRELTPAPAEREDVTI